MSTSHPTVMQRWATPQKTMPFQVLVPEIEIIRYYYVTSEYLAKRAFDDTFSRPDWFEHVFCTRNESLFYNLDSGEARLVSRLPFPKCDAPVLGRVAFDGSQSALRGIQRIYNSCNAQRLNSISYTPITYPRTHFPFSGKTTLTLSGMRRRIVSPITGEDEWIFLVHRIISCTGPFPFKKLSYSDSHTPSPRDVTGTNGGGLIGFQLSDMEDAETDLPEGASLNDEAPGPGLKLITDLTTREFSGLADVPIVFESPVAGSSTGTPGASVSHEIQQPLNASTGDPTSGASTSAQQSVQDWTFSLQRAPVDLAMFLAALEIVATQNPQWHVETIDISRGYQNEAGEWISLFPKVRCGIRKSMYRQFSFLDEEKSAARSVVCAKISAGGQYVYVLEAQRRTRDLMLPGQSPYKEEIPIALFRDNGYCELHPGYFKKLLTLTVIKETWPADELLINTTKDKTYHGNGAQNAEDFARRISQLIGRHI